MTCYSRPAVRRHTGEPEPVQLEHPEPATDPSQRGQRKPRCRILSRRTSDRCSNEALDELGICLRHIEEISAHWADIVGAIIDRLGGDEGGKLRAIVDTLKKYSGGRE